MTEAMPRFQTGGNRRILVVEDEPINQEILRAILKDSFEIVVTATGTECLEIVRTQAHSLSLILLDLNLPDMHGLEVLRQLKAEERLAGLPVIVMTADVDTEVESLTLGAIDFIPKPYPQPAVIRARVTRTIELVEDRDIIRGTERDRLTGLYNREFFDRYCGQLDAWLPDQPMDAIAIDINHFHIFNERYGKTAGDNLLRQVGRILSETLKDEQSVICRQGADTFLVYRPHRNDYEQMMKALSVKEKEGMDSTPVRMRMGVYANADRSLEIQRRFDRAKQAADSVRSSFHRAIGMYDDKMRKTEVFHEQLLDSFETALREGQFQVWYQPKYNIQKEPFTVCSAEALIRWNHPAMGMISPAVFIPLFEQNGLIQELDRFVWQEAARQVREWKETLGISVPVSVNVSRVDLYDPNIVSHLFGLANRNQLTYGELLLEVTESAYTANSEQIVEKVQMLRERGFRIEMDDFGSGYSSLNMLSELPIDALKLDMEFIRGAFRKRKDTRLLEAVIRLAESLEVTTIAEGVETAEQLLALKSMGCDIVQGYYFSKPLPADEFMAFIRENQRPDLAPPESGTKAEQPDDGR